MESSSSSSKKSNKISDIVRLQQILKKWKKLANAPKNSNKSGNNNNNSSSISSSSSGSSKGMKFLKKTLSFSDSSVSSVSNDVVPKGFLAVCVGKELKRYIIPTEYLGHQAFGLLLREAEEEFGFQQEGVLKIPCEVSVFERILKIVQEKRDVFFANDFGFNAEKEMIGFYSPDCELTPTHHPQLCR
ncbi:Small auxin-up RNA [Dillenia turbinata]|uniref:Small auxin-up RNA n=1 Tax=Dillenia turbinata TaxID=194707 RepID=A0AAN8U991_9MAGN